MNLEAHCLLPRRRALTPCSPAPTSLPRSSSGSSCGGTAQARITAAFYSRRTTNLVVLPADRSFTPTHAAMLRRKPIAATASIQHQQARTCGKIPIAHAAPPTLTSRDFVPWRFLDAGRNTAWIVSASRRPKTCTKSEVAGLFDNAAIARVAQRTCRPGRGIAHRRRTRMGARSAASRRHSRKGRRAGQGSDASRPARC